MAKNRDVARSLTDSELAASIANMRRVSHHWVHNRDVAVYASWMGTLQAEYWRRVKIGAHPLTARQVMQSPFAA